MFLCVVRLYRICTAQRNPTRQYLKGHLQNIACNFPLYFDNHIILRVTYYKLFIHLFIRVARNKETAVV